MQSTIQSDFEIKTFHATWADMKNFKKFICKIEKECEGQCAVKIVPPFKRKPSSKNFKNDEKLKTVIVQGSEKIVTNDGVGFELSYNEAKEMTYREFRQAIAKNEQMEQTTEEREDRAWRKLEEGGKLSLYAMYNQISLFDESSKFMNLNAFTTAESLIHKKGVKLDGITKPYVYIGSWPTYFGFHLEDGNLNSINYLHRGSPKIWYFVPITEHHKLEALANKFGKAVLTTCNNFLRLKALLIPPSVLKSENIRFARIIQNPGEYIVSLAGGYHSGFNCGWNEAESINFGSERWLQLFPDFIPCGCKDSHASNVREVKKILANICRQDQQKLQKKNNSLLCDVCQKRFTLKQNLRRHMENTHSNKVKRYVCSICKIDFSRKGGLSDHMINHHKTNLNMENVKRITTKNPIMKRSKSGSLREAIECETCGVVVHGKRHRQRKHKQLRHSMETNNLEG